MSPTHTMSQIEARERCAPSFSWTGPFPIGQPPKQPPKQRGPFLPLKGGTMRGPLILDGDPTDDLEAATKQYVDAMVASGGTFVDAPADGRMYVRLNHDWHELAVDGGAY